MNSSDNTAKGPSEIIAWVLLLLAHQAMGQARPNIVLLISDDQSWPHAGAYGDKTVKTPAFDKIAGGGVLFNRVFTASPSCSPSRAAILTGRNIWELESASNLNGVFPDSLEHYPRILQKAGYEVGSQGKGWGPGRSDVKWANNPAGPSKSFADFYRNRDKSKPFCFWFGSNHPHRPYPKGAGEEAGKKPEDVALPAHLPDHPAVRSDLLDYALQIDGFDGQLKNIYEILELDGNLENTLLVVTSDNGMPFPRAKSNLYDAGTRMPLAISWPAKVKGGRMIDDLVSLVDLAPTFLEAAGMPIPGDMRGKSLFSLLTSGKAGAVEPERDRVFMAMERHSSARDNNFGYPMRAIRTGHHLYIWNIRPERWPAGNPNGYYDIDDGPSKAYLRDDFVAGGGPDFFRLAMGIRPEHELYDLRRDPYQLKNAAYNPSYSGIREELRQKLRDYLRETGDPHLSGKGDAFETYPQVREIRDISPVAPTEPYIDSLKGAPGTALQSQIARIAGPRYKCQRISAGWSIRNLHATDITVFLRSTDGRLLRALHVPKSQTRVLRKESSWCGVAAFEIRGRGSERSAWLSVL